MAFLHCHNCDWEQDDFYSMDGYNPPSYLITWNKYLCGDAAHRIDEQFTDDAEFIRENGPITTREVIARQYEHYAKRIRTMQWITHEQFEREPNKVCPKCGSKDLDID